MFERHILYMRKALLLAVVAVPVWFATSPAAAGNAKVEICHLPPGNPANAHSIDVSQNALRAHLAHGDLEGGCDSHCAVLCGEADACPIDGCEDFAQPRTFIWHGGPTAPSAFPAGAPNPFRGRQTPSTYSALPAGTSYRRYYAGSEDLAALPAGDPLRPLLWAGSVPGDGYTDLVDPTPDPLAGLFEPEFLSDGVTRNPLWTNYYYRAPRDNAWFFRSPDPSFNDIQKFGGDYSGKAECVKFDLGLGTGPWNYSTGVISGPPTFPDPAIGFAKCDPAKGCPGTPGSPVEVGQGCSSAGPFSVGTPYCDQLAGQNHNGGCLSFRNTRVTGGTGEHPLRPAPDRSNLFTPVDSAVAQGLAFPPPASPAYERRVDLATGEPLTARDAEIPDAGEIRAPANRDPKNYASMSPAGIGRAPANLKPGGAAGGLNQNGFTVARDNDPLSSSYGEPVYLRTDDRGNPLPGPNSRFVTNGDDTWYPLFELDPIRCSGLGEFPDCQPQRYEVGLAEATVNGDLFAAGWSPQNALENHPADQGLFACICDAELEIADGLDPNACAFNTFGSRAPLDRYLAPFPLVETLSCLMAGEIGGTCNGFMSVFSKNVQGANNRRESGIVPLNRDPNDGLITATSNLFNRDQKPLSGTSFFGVAILNMGTAMPGDEDMLTLDSTLTAEQRALLGCGPLFGTRCDSSVRITGGVFGINLCTAFGLGCTEGGGIDLLNAEATAVLHATVGLEGTDPSDPIYTGNPLHPEWAQWAAGGANFVGTEFESDGIWLTTSGLPQPGTIGSPIGAACTRFDPETNETVILPGCRGIRSILNRETARQDGEIVFEFDDDYYADIDGCPLGETIDGVPVRGVYADGSPVDLGPCSESTHKTGGFYAWAVGNSDASHPAQGLPGLIDWDGRPQSTSQARMSRPGAGTLWHPYAGCFANPADALAGRECVSIPYEDIAAIADPTSPEHNAALAARLARGGGVLDPVSGRYLGGVKIVGDVPRDFESAFFVPGGAINIGGETVYGVNLQSQIFRSEIAALSFNFNQFLIQTSCDQRFDDIDGQAECFNPNNQFAVGKCSYATPQLCRNVQLLQGLTLPVPAAGSSVPAVCQ